MLRLNASILISSLELLIIDQRQSKTKNREYFKKFDFEFKCVNSQI